MQNRKFKILIFLFLGLISFLETSYSQGFKEELKTADSLFQQKRYTQSLTLYEKIVREEQQASPAMLLKMAFIYESLEDLSNTLYSLNSFYLLTSDKRVLIKMTELAQTHNLEGYSTNDFDLFLKFYDEHRQYFVLITLALGILILSMILKRKKKLNEKSVGLSFGLLTIVFVAFLLINFSKLAPKGIITSANTYLMTGPSAGSDLLEITGEGHKVEVIGKKDIWLEIKWKSGRAFIRENNIQRLPN